jgi:hypothetical protein
MTPFDPQTSIPGIERDSLLELQKTLEELAKNVVSAQSKIDQISKIDRRRGQSLDPAKSAEILLILGPAIEHVSGLENSFHGLLTKSDGLKNEFVNKVENLKSDISRGVDGMNSLKKMLKEVSNIANECQVSNEQNRAPVMTHETQGTQPAHRSLDKTIDSSTSTRARGGHTDPYPTPEGGSTGSGDEGASTKPRGEKRPAPFEDRGKPKRRNQRNESDDVSDKPTFEFSPVLRNDIPAALSRTFGTPSPNPADVPTPSRNLRSSTKRTPPVR